MRAHEILSEIDRMPGNEYTGGKKSLRIGAGDKNIRKLPGTNAFMYSTEANHMEDGIIIKLWDSANTTPKPVKMRDEDDEEFAWRLKDWERNQSEDGPGFLIGKLVLEDVPYFPLKGALQVDTITVDEDYRGQGIAKSLYGVALSILRRPLLAGRSQTPGGRRNWLSLASIPGVDIKGYVAINEARFDNPAWAEKDIDIVMGKLGGQYIGPSRPPGIHYFAFDVVPGSGELAPAVRTELSKIYNEHGSRTGLYAIWSGAVNKQGVAENTAAGINKLFNNLGDPVFANLQRVALLAMQGRQSEADGRLQTVIKDADPAVQKKITDAVNNIKPVTINGRVADSSTLDKSKQHNDWIINTFIPWVQSLLGQQSVAENFADGKNPGRKGLAKRSGVNTKASVSSLRKTAKNSSGEKQRMAHWLANMKAGRAKK